MKTVEEIYLYIENLSELRLTHKINSKDIFQILQDFEILTRKDQDRITRQACIEILNNCKRMWSGEYRVDSWIDLDDAHQAIMDM